MSKMKDNQYEHNSFVLYKDSRIFIDRLNKEQRGDLLAAIFLYVCDGEILDFNDDGMVQMCFEIIKSYLDRDERKYQEKCRKNKENIEKRWSKTGKQSNTNVYGSKQSNTNCTDKDTDTDSVSVNDTDTDTVRDTDTDHVDVVSADRPVGAAAAEGAAPQSDDLFSVNQLLATAKKNKVNLTEDGIRIFHEEMQESGWILYGRSVEKKGIVKTLRGWAKYHPEYGLVPQKYFKAWLRYHGYFDGTGDFTDEISVDEEIMDIVFETTEPDNEPMQKINERLKDAGFGMEDIKPLIMLFRKWMSEENAP